MEAKLIDLLILIFLAVTNALPVDDNRDEVYIPSLIKNIYDKMSAVLDQDEPELSEDREDPSLAETSYIW